jgi:hypothetical protein
MTALDEDVLLLTELASQVDSADADSRVEVTNIK